MEEYSARLQARLTAREVELARLQATISALYASTSWRITAPMRAVGRLIGPSRFRAVAAVNAPRQLSSIATPTAAPPHSPRLSVPSLAMESRDEIKPLDIEMEALAERYYGPDANRKPAIYLAEYEKLFGPMRNAPLRLLELGVRFGASMFLWSDYFPNATIVGLDIDDRPERFPADKRVHFVQGRQDDPATLDKCAAVAGGPFDIIVDDASHIGRLSAASFAYLFPRALKPRGFYVIEDICTAFLPEFPDSEPFSPPEIGRHQGASRFPSHQAGMVGVVKQIFDHVMAPAAQGRHSQFAIERMLVLTNIAVIAKAA